MFRSARWRSEKNKIKAVFKLQFHATQVSQLVADALIVSVVPGDATKPTSRLEKASIRDGSCNWESPIYETVKFTRDPKNGRFSEKIYHFIISTGAAKSSFVGEVSVDLADYAEITKAALVSLPLNKSSSNSILHVSIQRLQENADQREEVAEIEDAKSEVRDRSLRSIFSNSSEIDGSTKSTSIEDLQLDKPTENAESNLNFSGSSISDITLSSSDSSSGLDTPRENAVQNNMDRAMVIYNFDLQNTHEKDKVPDMEVERLKSEVSALTRQVDMSELELQSLRKQIVKESRRSQDLLREVASLKAVKNRSQHEGNGDPQILLEELNYEKNLNSDLRLQLHKTQESNSELILAVKDLDGLLGQKDQEISNLSRKLRLSCLASDDDEQKALEEIVNDHRIAKETYVLEQRILDLSSEVEIYRRDRDELEMQIEQIALDYEILKQKHHEVSCKWEQSRLQEQLSNVNEMVAKIESLENELANQSKEFSDSLVTNKELENRVVVLEEEMEKKAEEFEADLEVVTKAKVESEQRAIQAEAALKKMKWKNVSTAEKLQEEFKRLSLQMAASFDANERVAVKALKEAGELRMQKNQMEETLKRTNSELQMLRDEVGSKEEQIKKMLLEMDEKSKRVKHCEELEKEIEELKAEIFRLAADNDLLSKELKRVKESTDEAELAVMRENAEKNEMESALTLLKKQLMESEVAIIDLESQRERLKKRCEGMKHSILKDEAEKEKLRNQVCDLKEELKNKEGELVNFMAEIKLLEIKEAAQEDTSLSFLEKERDYQDKIEELQIRLEELSSSQAANGNGGFTSEIGSSDDTISEVKLLKERKEFAEIELKEMQEKYFEISVKFAEVEGERQKLVMTVRNLKNAKKRS